MDGTEGAEGRGRHASGKNKLGLGMGQEEVRTQDRLGRLVHWEAHRPEDRRPRTRLGKTAGSGNQDVFPHWVPGRNGRGKGV